MNPKANQTKVPFLSELSIESKALFMCITETHLSNDEFDAEIHIQNYTIYRTDRKERDGGGVCIYAQDKLTCSVILSESNTICDILILKEQSLNLVVCLIYRPPNCKKVEFLPCVEKIRNILSEHSDCKFLLLGDMNFPTIDWSDPKNPKLPYSSNESDQKVQIDALLELTDELLLDQLISEPTRGKNTLDLTFTNITSDLFDCKITKCEAMSDHNIIDMLIPDICSESTRNEIQDNSQPGNSETELSDLNFYKSDWLKIRSEISQVNWKEIMKDKDADNKLSIMMKTIKEITVKYTPKKRNNKRRNKTSFFKQRRALWRKRRRLITTMLNSKNTVYKDSLNANIEKIHSEIRKSFEEEQIEEENKAIEKIIVNPKYFFAYSKQKLQTRSKIGPLSKDNRILKEPTEIAECLQEQFCSVFSSPDQSKIINDIDEHFNCDDSTGLQDIDFSEEDIEKMISEIKSSAACGEDGFSALLLKNCKKELSVPLYILWRYSLDNSEVPIFLKRSKICPIHKGSLKSVPKNYRPVALTSHLIKLFEKIIRREIVQYLEENNLMNKNQHGFRKFRSCLSQLLDHYDLLIEMLQSRSKDNVDVVYLDFSKAFDVVDHNILLHKLKGLGIHGKIGKWIHQFLANRTQYVTVEGHASTEAPVLSGVPQGSVLGPVLFLIMISDIDENINSVIKTFADDTKVTQQICSPEDSKILQESLEKIYEWARKNNMKFNSSKFNLLRYGNNSELKQCTSYKDPNNEIIKEEDHVKDLGVQMSANLTFTEHITLVSKKAKRLVYWILRAFKTRKKEPLLKLYCTLVQPRLDYCSQLFSPHKQLEWKLMEAVQRTLTSRISEISHLNYWERLSELKMYSVHRRHERYQIVYIYKILENLVPNLSVNKIESKYSERRGRLCIIPTLANSQCPSAIINAREASLPLKGAKLYNILPKYLRNITGISVESFKHHLDKYLLTIPDEPTVDGYYGMRAANTNSLIDVISMMRVAEGHEVTQLAEVDHP